jgi:hypothetical protein
MNKTLIATLLCVSIIFGQADMTNAQGGPQSGNTPASSKPGAGKPTSGKDKNKTDPPDTLPGKLAGDVNTAANDSSDYVPCFFTREQLLNLRPKPEAATLSSGDAEALRSKVIAEAFDPANATAFEDGKAEEFAQEIGNEVFEGLTRSQATSRVLGLLNDKTKADTESVSEAALAEYAVDRYAPTATPEQRLRAFVAANTATGKVGKIMALDGALNTTALKQEADKLAGTGEAAVSKNHVAEASIQAINEVGRPTDIGCSMSILSYETTRKAFGETMAEEYIGVQIVVRNINPSREFLVQSAEFKVDDDINGRLGRYFSGVDKTTAREYMLASRDFGKRNLTIHVAQGVSSILSAFVPFTGPAVKQLSGVYSGGFTSALTAIFPDHNTEQLKLIDDEGFSNGRTDRTVVPKSGTVEFVIFISSKQYEEGWWTQDCAEEITIEDSSPTTPSPDPQPNADSKPDPKPDPQAAARCLGTYKLASPDPRCVESEIGIDLDAARRVCRSRHPDDSYPVITEAGKASLKSFKPRVKPYRHWSQQAQAIFRELSLAVVAGTHVTEDNDTKPALTKLDCPVDDKGNVKFDSATNGTLACTVTGTNLDKVAQLKLRNSQDAADTAVGEGTVSTSGDSKTAKASFDIGKLGALNAKAYKAYTVTGDGVEADSGQLLHLDDAPYLTSAASNPSPIDLAKLQAKDAAKVALTLKGYHLDKLTEVDLTGNGASTIKLPVGSSAAASEVTLSLGPDDIKGKIPSGVANPELTITLIPSSPNSPTQKLSFTGQVPAPAPAPTSKPVKKRSHQ